MQSVTDFAAFTPASIEQPYQSLLNTSYHRLIEKALLDALEYRRVQWSPDRGKVLLLSFARVRGQADVIFTRLQRGEEKAARRPQVVGSSTVVAFTQSDGQPFDLKELAPMIGYDVGPSPANFRRLVMHICVEKIAVNGFICTDEICEIQCLIGQFGAFSRKDHYLKLTWS